MKIVKEYNCKDFVFDNIKSTSNVESIEINGEVINVNYTSIIDTQFSGGNIGIEFENLKKKLGLGIYSKAECGGFVNLYRVKSNNGKDYILFSGVNEVSNSHYIVTIQKIIEE